MREEREERREKGRERREKREGMRDRSRSHLPRVRHVNN